MILIIRAIPRAFAHSYRRCGFLFSKDGHPVIFTGAEKDGPIVAGEPYQIGKKTQGVLEAEAAKGMIGIVPADMNDAIGDGRDGPSSEDVRKMIDHIRSLEGEIGEVRSQFTGLRQELAAAAHDLDVRARRITELEATVASAKKGPRG